MILRNKRGQFLKGNSGIWLGKKRPDVSGENNPRWAGKRNDHVCQNCGNKFRRAKPTTNIPKYCGMKCYGESKITTASRNRNEYKDWTIQILKRDGHHCKICKTDKLLIAHHIKTFEKYPKLRTALSNGMTLCRGCHIKLHRQNRNVHDFTKILRDYMPNIA